MSLSAREFKAQLHDESDAQPRSMRRVIVNGDVLKSMKLSTGDVVALSKQNGTKFAVGVLWACPDVPPTSVSISGSHLLSLGVTEGQAIRVIPLALTGPASRIQGIPSLKHAKDATNLRLKEVGEAKTGVIDKEKVEWLTLASREVLVDLKYVLLGQIFQVAFEGVQRLFTIASINSPATSNEDEVVADLSRLSLTQNAQLWVTNWDTNVQITNSSPQPSSSQSPQDEVDKSTQLDGYTSVGGLSKQIEEITDLLEIPLTRPELFRHFGLKPPRGILLHGPPGTGKTHLARAIAASTKSSVLVINGPELSSAYHGETESRLRQVFKEAEAKSPCIVVLDEVDALVPRREDGAGGEVEKRVVATLLTILDGMEDGKDDSRGKVVVIGTTNRPNAIDPALRRPGRFDREIEIGIPDAEARLSILNVLLSKTPHAIPQDGLRALASRAHGYVGADLSAVVREAGTLAIKRWTKAGDHVNNPLPELQLRDLEAALLLVRASAMRSVFVEAPPVRYSDIGGQSSVIQKLREAVEWPLLHPEAFQRLGVKPPKGVLLYGPPGCSKTVLARACATESGINFVAVKGPELLNKYVGESERGVREIFRKARAASPSIIFFDEIDALATSRSSSETDSGSSSEGVLTSLLNEMDGVQELVGVTVIAATNRPETIDSALMRPGRLDRILYVSPPDTDGREEILRIKLKGMTVGPDVDIKELAQLTVGCSGAEITAMCQEAALETMRSDIAAPYVPHSAFVSAAKSTKTQITPSVLAKFASWQAGVEVRHL
ncbi:AAA family ATPase [Ephemerocybe angulata]|uniref:AAA family ATPase n=1 Tax=Ephemerocybe angulata TaxID=980116 RepID=A0A8H6MCM5_9AGAR|nr:AAA family ATPase [Tulosesus angulatus]